LFGYSSNSSYCGGCIRHNLIVYIPLKYEGQLQLFLAFGTEK